MQIQVEVLQIEKPYLGGYRNPKNGKIYHNAFAQTDQIRREHATKFERDVFSNLMKTQTYDYSTKSAKMKREMGTQMERRGILIDTRSDKTLIPNPYFTSEMWSERREEAALYIQRMTRGWLARVRASILKKQKENRRNEQLLQEEEIRKTEGMKHHREIERRMHPKSKEDFKILFDELEIWRASEIRKIKENTKFTEIERKAALKTILDKETELLQTIDRLKLQANLENKEEKIKAFLKAISDPKCWPRSDGRFTEVHTPFTMRAKELKDIYFGLLKKSISIDERLDTLLLAKRTVAAVEFQNDLTKEIIELIDREADRINRGRPEGSLDGLRKRIGNLFLQFIETPEFNPESAKFQKIPYELLLANMNDKVK